MYLRQLTQAHNLVCPYFHKLRSCDMSWPLSRKQWGMAWGRAPAALEVLLRLQLQEMFSDLSSDSSWTDDGRFSPKDGALMFFFLELATNIHYDGRLP